ncbi:MAG TPA: hypothetical protein VF796_02415 [Humisphaera sp.]
MATAPSVYLLGAHVSDPRYRGFDAVDTASLLGRRDVYRDFYPSEADGESPRLAGVWRPLRVVGPVRTFNDVPWLGMYIPTFSPRAVAALRDLLEPNGELLPLVSDLGTYHAYNVTTVADVLDYDAADVVWHDVTPWWMDMERYELHAGRLDGLTVFRIREDPHGVYVTEPFVRRVRAAGLKGFAFHLVWPVPADTTWRELRTADWQRHHRAGLPPGRTLDDECVSLDLPALPGRLAETDQTAADRVVAALDAALTDRHREAPPIGWPVNIAHEGDRWTILLACPDADALLDHLAPILPTLPWPAPVTPTKHAVPYDHLL